MYRGLKNGVQDVAVKVLGHSGPAQLQQFEHEIKLLKGISFDRNIIQVTGVGRGNVQQPWLPCHQQKERGFAWQGNVHSCAFEADQPATQSALSPLHVKPLVTMWCT